MSLIWVFLCLHLVHSEPQYLDVQNDPPNPPYPPIPVNLPRRGSLPNWRHEEPQYPDDSNYPDYPDGPNNPINPSYLPKPEYLPRRGHLPKRRNEQDSREEDLSSDDDLNNQNIAPYPPKSRSSYGNVYDMNNSDELNRSDAVDLSKDYTSDENTGTRRFLPNNKNYRVVVKEKLRIRKPKKVTRSRIVRTKIRRTKPVLHKVYRTRHYKKVQRPKTSKVYKIYTGGKSGGKQINLTLFETGSDSVEDTIKKKKPKKYLDSDETDESDESDESNDKDYRNVYTKKSQVQYRPRYNKLGLRNKGNKVKLNHENLDMAAVYPSSINYDEENSWEGRYSENRPYEGQIEAKSKTNDNYGNGGYIIRKTKFIPYKFDNKNQMLLPYQISSSKGESDYLFYNSLLRNRAGNTVSEMAVTENLPVHNSYDTRTYDKETKLTYPKHDLSELLHFPKLTTNEETLRQKQRPEYLFSQSLNKISPKLSKYEERTVKLVPYQDSLRVNKVATEDIPYDLKHYIYRGMKHSKDISEESSASDEQELAESQHLWEINSSVNDYPSEVNEFSKRLQQVQQFLTQNKIGYNGVPTTVNKLDTEVDSSTESLSETEKSYENISPLRVSASVDKYDSNDDVLSLSRTERTSVDKDSTVNVIGRQSDYNYSTNLNASLEELPPTGKDDFDVHYADDTENTVVEEDVDVIPLVTRTRSEGVRTTESYPNNEVTNFLQVGRTKSESEELLLDLPEEVYKSSPTITPDTFREVSEDLAYTLKQDYTTEQPVPVEYSLQQDYTAKRLVPEKYSLEQEFTTKKTVSKIYSLEQDYTTKQPVPFTPLRSNVDQEFPGKSNLRQNYLPAGYDAGDVYLGNKQPIPIVINSKPVADYFFTEPTDTNLSLSVADTVDSSTNSDTDEVSGNVANAKRKHTDVFPHLTHYFDDDYSGSDEESSVSDVVPTQDGYVTLETGKSSLDAVPTILHHYSSTVSKVPSKGGEGFDETTGPKRLPLSLPLITPSLNSASAEQSNKESIYKEEIVKLCSLAKTNLKNLRAVVANTFGFNTDTADENDLLSIVYILGKLNEARATKRPVENLVDDFLVNLQRLAVLRKLLCKDFDNENFEKAVRDQVITNVDDGIDILSLLKEYSEKTGQKLTSYYERHSPNNANVIEVTRTGREDKNRDLYPKLIPGRVGDRWAINPLDQEVVVTDWKKYPGNMPLEQSTTLAPADLLNKLLGMYKPTKAPPTVAPSFATATLHAIDEHIELPLHVPQTRWLSHDITNGYGFTDYGYDYGTTAAVNDYSHSLYHYNLSEPMYTPHNYYETLTESSLDESTTPLPFEGLVPTPATYDNWDATHADLIHHIDLDHHIDNLQTENPYVDYDHHVDNLQTTDHYVDYHPTKDHNPTLISAIETKLHDSQVDLNTAIAPESYRIDGVSSAEYEELMDELKHFSDQLHENHVILPPPPHNNLELMKPRKKHKHFNLILNGRKLSFKPGVKNENHHKVIIKGVIHKVDLENIVKVAHHESIDHAPVDLKLRTLFEQRDRVDEAIVSEYMWKEIDNLRSWHIDEHKIDKYVYTIATSVLPDLFKNLQKCQQVALLKLQKTTKKFRNKIQMGMRMKKLHKVLFGNQWHLH